MSAKTLSEKTITLVRVRVRVRGRGRVRSVVGGGDHLVAARLVEAHQVLARAELVRVHRVEQPLHLVRVRVRDRVKLVRGGSSRT